VSAGLVAVMAARVSTLMLALGTTFPTSAYQNQAMHH